MVPASIEDSREADLSTWHSGIEETLRTPFTRDNSIRLLSNGPEAFQVIFDTLAGARNQICLEFYIFRADETGRHLAEILKRKAAEGVAVFLKYDHFGSFGTPASFWNGLRATGIHVKASRPFLWQSPRLYTRRNHRKLIVVDGETSFTGGFNIGDEYRGLLKRRRPPWRDTGIMMTGPVSAALLRQFARSWNRWGESRSLPVGPPIVSKDGKASVIPIFSGSARERRRMRKLFYYSIRASRRSIHLTTAYFTPSMRLVERLEEAVKRGVEVNLLLPGRSDLRAPFYAGRHFFSRLMKRGVRIHLYEGEILHAKTAVFDGVWSVIGSANLDFRSLRVNDEGNVGVLGREFGDEMIRLFDNDLKLARPLDPARWAGRPFCEKFQEWFFGLFRRRL